MERFDWLVGREFLVVLEDMASDWWREDRVSGCRKEDSCCSQAELEEWLEADQTEDILEVEEDRMEDS